MQAWGQARSCQCAHALTYTPMLTLTLAHTPHRGYGGRTWHPGDSRVEQFPCPGPRGSCMWPGGTGPLKVDMGTPLLLCPGPARSPMAVDTRCLSTEPSLTHCEHGLLQGALGLTLDAVLNALACDALVFLKHCGETPPLRGPADLRATQHRRRRLHIPVPPATSARFSGTGSRLPGGVPRFPGPAASPAGA